MNKVLVFAIFGFIFQCSQNQKSEVADERASTKIESHAHSFKFETIATEFNKLVDNYHLFIDDTNQALDTLQDFVNDFRKDYCRQKCNIYLYDDKTMGDLAKKYPLTDDEYVLLADHFIAASVGDVTEVDMHPLKDDKYRKLKRSRK